MQLFKPIGPTFWFTLHLYLSLQRKFISNCFCWGVCFLRKKRRKNNSINSQWCTAWDIAFFSRYYIRNTRWEIDSLSDRFLFYFLTHSESFPHGIFIMKEYLSKDHPSSKTTLTGLLGWSDWFYTGSYCIHIIVNWINSIEQVEAWLVLKMVGAVVIVFCFLLSSVTQVSFKG